ncbi:FKBP-type peptidyl-prolyl cis-trans isomerase, putative, partial [Ixodes scapularis]
ITPGVLKTVIQPGFGPRPNVGDNITVHCTGLLTNPPRKFWSTRDPGQQPFSFRVGVGEVIRGWDEGCLSMQKNEVSRLTVCGQKAYGAQGFPAISIASDVGSSWRGLSFLNRAITIPPNADLQFEIQILAINGM